MGQQQQPSEDQLAPQGVVTSIASRRTVAFAAAVAGLIAVLATTALQSLDGETSVARGELIAVEDREPAPTDRRPLLEGDGELGLGDLRGAPVVLNFWGSWCGPCRKEQPDLNRVHDDYAARGVQFLGVDVQDSRPNGLAHVREFDMPYDSLFDPNYSYAALFGGIGPRAIPTTLIVDSHGRVAARLFGITSYRELSLALERLLTEESIPGS